MDYLNRKYTNISLALMYWKNDVPKNKDTIISFIKGFDAGREREFQFSNYFYHYIYSTHQIKHINWIRQVNTFAYRENLNWTDAFHQLFFAFTKHPEPAFSDLIHWNNSTKDTLHIEEINFGKTITSSISINGIEFKAGQILQLADKIGDSFKNTVHYDINIIDPSWDLYNESEDDFLHINLFIKKDLLNDINYNDFQSNLILNKLRKIFSNYTSEIKFFSKQNNKYYAYTDYLAIDLQSALNNREVKLVESRRDNDIKYWDNYFAEFHEILSNYKMGFIPEKELFKSLNTSFWYHNYLDWINYESYLSGWKKVNKKEDLEK